ncbi:MAG: helix-turn-helix transcriptional regulator [Archangium sp.]|nr:helix-turn-helix transcriptional regulator [Archangium sp.]
MLLLMQSPAEVCQELGARCRGLRLELGWTQAELARRAGVALSTLRHFERTGQISLERLVMLAATLRSLDAFEKLLQLPQANSLEEIEARQTKRQRGRRSRS